MWQVNPRDANAAVVHGGEIKGRQQKYFPDFQQLVPSPFVSYRTRLEFFCRKRSLKKVTDSGIYVLPALVDRFFFIWRLPPGHGREDAGRRAQVPRRDRLCKGGKLVHSYLVLHKKWPFYKGRFEALLHDLHRQ